MPICLRLLVQLMRAAASRTFCTAGSSRPMSTAMIAITTSSSIKLNALPGCRHLGPFTCIIERPLVENHGPRVGHRSFLPGCLPVGYLGGGRHLPDLHGPVRAGRGDPVAVGAERHALHPTGVAVEGAALAAGLVPDL